MNNVIQMPMGQAIQQNFVAYAMDVIKDRALPEIRDGLKPVHRRILWSMQELGLTNEKAFKKSARIVGEVLGKYHPHGDQSVYQAMVNMAQDFSTRYPLVNGHGNWGSVDGDSAAAMRYTEAKMTKYGQALMDDIKKNTVDFKLNFDGEESEPVVLSTLIPNLLANGSSGIAVGMATNIPPHNLSDLYDVLMYMVDSTMDGVEPDEDTIISTLKAPDFPTGAKIINPEEVAKAYKTGKGRVIVKSVFEIEDNNIVITELPYKVNKANLLGKIANLVNEKKITGISDIRDESDRNGMRAIIELKRNVNPQLVINNLLKYTDLQTSVSMNFVLLKDGQAEFVPLITILNSFLAHSAEVILRRTQFDIDKGMKRHNILQGLFRCYEDDMIEQVINAIRTADDEVQALIELGFNAEQAEYIANMRIKTLSKSSRERLEKEFEELNNNMEYWNSILNDQMTLLCTMKNEYLQLKDRFADERRTAIVNESSSIDEEDLVVEETLVITITNNNLIKSVSEKEYNAQKRGGKGTKATDTKEDEFIKYMFTTHSKDNLLFFTNTGRVHLLKAYKIPKSNRSARGKSIFNFLNLDSENGEHIVNVINANMNDKEKSLLLATYGGVVKRLALSELPTKIQTYKVITFKEGDSLTAVMLVSEGDNVIFNTSKGLSLTTTVTTKSIRPMGRTATGVTAMRFKTEGDHVVDMSLCNKPHVFTLTENGIGKRTPIEEFSVQNRGGKGIASHKLNERTGSVVAATTVDDTDDIFIVTKQGQMIRTSASGISVTSRNSSGVKLVSLSEGDSIASISTGACMVEEEGEE